ncbi:1,4-alpha-glucan branching enzyme [Lachnospiraceae bacterium RM5]|nr:1,4-alpha-glucan branching enzyme [Lachnospiraceae bacterium RM5]
MFNKLYNMMNWPVIEGIEYSDIDNPHDILGVHECKSGMLIQTYHPEASEMKIKISGKVYDMHRMDDEGFFAYLYESHKKPSYKLIVVNDEGEREFFDPYAFDVMSDFKELRKLNAGIFYDAYEFLGAHECKIDRVSGVRFDVWAPSAMRVSVIGEFNNWDGRIHQMTRLGDTGIFEIFIPGVKEGDLYKFEIKKNGDENIIKSDPYSFKIESLPGDASIVKSIDSFDWEDKDFIDKRDKNKDGFDGKAVSIYETSLSNYIEDGKFDGKAAAKKVVAHVKKAGYTHVEIMPIVEYIGEDNPYGPASYFYSVSNIFGDADNIKEFVNELHKNDIGVILDWTPNAFAPNDNALTSYDGSCLYEHSNPKRGYNANSNVKLFNYARLEVTSFLLANAFMWIEKFHFDGLKIVNVASILYLDYNKKIGEWDPNIYGGNDNLDGIEFIKHFNSIIHNKYNGIITIADDNSGYPELTGEVDEDHLGFDLEYNFNWRKDILSYMVNPPYLRGNNYNDLSLSMVYQYSEKYIVGINEDEFVNGNASLFEIMPGDIEERKYDNLKLLLAYGFVHPGKKLVFKGQDSAEKSAWSFNKTEETDINEDILKMVGALNELYKEEKALHELDEHTDGFEWINNISARESILTFVRKGEKEEDLLLVVCNFEAIDRENYKVGVPLKGKYKEIFSTAKKEFGGTGEFVNPRLKQSKTDECDGREESVRINVPALSISIFKYSKVLEKVKPVSEKIKATTKKAATTKTATTKKTAATKAAATKKKAATKAATKKATTAKKPATKKATTKKTTKK